MTWMNSLAETMTGTTLALLAGGFLLLVSCLVVRGRSKAAKVKAQRLAVTPDEQPKELTLPVETDDPDIDERRAVSRYVAGLMMADEWTAIADKITEWEAKLESTPAGQRFHDIAAKVALSGLQNLIDEAPRDTLDDLAPADEELAHFMDTHNGDRENHILGLLAARAHMVIGDACRAEHWPEEMRKEAYRKMARHFVEAGEILENYDALALMSPMVAEAQYLQALGSPDGERKLEELFNTWIDLDPASAAIYETDARRLADAKKVEEEEIQRLAEAATERTEASLGFGGYALFFMPLLDKRDDARELLDTELFASALLDLASLSASQAEANWAAGRLAAEMKASEGDKAAVFSDMLAMLIDGHLNVVYPRLWPMPQDEVEDIISSLSLAPGLFKDSGDDSDLLKAA